jgi:hypothetical protein
MSQHEVQRSSLMIWRKSDEEHVHEPMTLCAFFMHQMQEVQEKHPLNRS